MSPIPAKQRRTSANQKARAQAATCVVGYLRCSTDEQAESGLGLDAQRAAVEAACAAKGWTVTEWAVDEGVSGSVARGDRTAMASTLQLLESREAGALVAAKVDRIARDLHDLTGLLRRADEEGGRSSPSTSEWTRRRPWAACWSASWAAWPSGSGRSSGNGPGTPSPPRRPTALASVARCPPRRSR